MTNSEAMVTIGTVICRQQGRYQIRLRVVRYTEPREELPDGVYDYLTKSKRIMPHRRLQAKSGVLLERLDNNSRHMPAGTLVWTHRDHFERMVSSFGYRIEENK